VCKITIDSFNSAETDETVDYCLKLFFKLSNKKVDLFFDPFQDEGDKEYDEEQTA
jgi:hypothetical protein